MKTNLTNKATDPGLQSQPPTDLVQGNLSVSGLRKKGGEKLSELPDLLSPGHQVLSWPRHKHELRKDLHGCEGS